MVPMRVAGRYGSGTRAHMVQLDEATQHLVPAHRLAVLEDRETGWIVHGTRHLSALLVMDEAHNLRGQYPQGVMSDQTVMLT